MLKVWISGIWEVEATPYQLQERDKLIEQLEKHTQVFKVKPAQWDATVIEVIEPIKARRYERVRKLMEQLEDLTRDASIPNREATDNQPRTDQQ